MFQRARTFFAEFLTAIQAIADGLRNQVTATRELTTAVQALTGQLDAITGPLAYLEASERTRNHRSGVQVQ